MASAAVAIRVASSSDSTIPASGGMYGFGDTILFVAAFGVSALVPTGAALFFLRPYGLFWKVLSASAFAFAMTGVTAAILFAVGRNESASRLAIWVQLSVLRILVSPLLALAFLACVVLSPHRSPRLAFLTAAVIEMAVSVYGVAFLIVFYFLHRP
jgi:hypothetical protein